MRNSFEGPASIWSIFANALGLPSSMQPSFEDSIHGGAEEFFAGFDEVERSSEAEIETTMQTRQPIPPATSSETFSTTEPVRRLRSLTMAWHDQESGDDLTVEVEGSPRFLEGLRPLGFVPLARRRAGARATGGSPSPRPRDPAEQRVHWTVRLVRHWNPESR